MLEAFVLGILGGMPIGKSHIPRRKISPYPLKITVRVFRLTLEPGKERWLEGRFRCMEARWIHPSVGDGDVRACMNVLGAAQVN